jgi:hypothetical protein
VVSLFLYKRYREEKRSKEAIAATAGLRMYFVQALQPTAFLDSALITTARQVVIKGSLGEQATVKLPVCEGILDDIREKL